ncbi:MAG TPA: heme biosynthesis HemY N-terminal domain-containing protein [Stellaceae bacterium]|nr:heme biosynthesis HemY N-terminal domain-containing protein [Stellaceae bacterium]
MRAIPALVAIALFVAAVVFVAEHPGGVVITWQGWEIETSVAVLALATAIAALVVIVLVSLLRFILHSPRNFARARRERRRREGYRALTQGMVAVAAGDAEEAQKLARRADSLLAEPPLTLLLSAQAAQLTGDERAAANYFTAMLERPETEFLGLRGLIMQALRDGDEATALNLATRAKELRPKTPWVMTYLLELQARRGSWQAAEATLVEAERRKALAQPLSSRRHAVILHQHSVEADAEGRGPEAMRLARKANALAPEFAPASVRYARMLSVRGQKRRARRTLEAAWRAAPHPAVAEAHAELFADEQPLPRMKHVARLAALNPDHIESRIALAASALQARLWGEARRHLAPVLGDTGETAAPRVCRLMAEIEESEHGDLAAARQWLTRAASAMVPDPAWVCSACGVESGEWRALCQNCHNFATLEWRDGERAPRRTLERTASATGLPPPQP